MGMDINYRKKSVKNTHTRRLTIHYLITKRSLKKSKRKSKKYLETNDKENTMTQNLWDAAEAVLRGKFIAIHSYLKKQATSQINNLTYT